jgi:hypothetical protein
MRMEAMIRGSMPRAIGRSIEGVELSREDPARCRELLQVGRGDQSRRGDRG